MNSDARQALPVSAVAELIKNIISQSISRIWIKGEVSNLKIQQNGNIYFSIKDEGAKMNALIMKFSKARPDAEQLKDGMEIVIYGNVSYYAKEGYISVFVEAVQLVGEGGLKQKFEELKNKLFKEGLFDAKYKKPIPSFPRVVGVVTSPSGAAIQDILQVTGRRFSNVHILVFPAAVQGENAAEEISRAIRAANRFYDKIDVLIVGRGGGSLEDLWCFNEESVARAIFNSKIPVISAVGHEIDFTIADFVSDQRAPTPSAAAELVVRDKSEIVRHLDNLKTRLEYQVQGKLEIFRRQLDTRGNEALRYILENKMSDLSLQLDNLTIRFQNQLSRYFKDHRHRIEVLKEKLHTLNPLNTLSRGYSITYAIRDKKTLSLSDSTQAQVGDILRTILHKGELISIVNEQGIKKNKE